MKGERREKMSRGGMEIISRKKKEQHLGHLRVKRRKYSLGGVGGKGEERV